MLVCLLWLAKYCSTVCTPSFWCVFDAVAPPSLHSCPLVVASFTLKNLTLPCSHTHHVCMKCACCLDKWIEFRGRLGSCSLQRLSCCFCCWGRRQGDNDASVFRRFRSAPIYQDPTAAASEKRRYAAPSQRNGSLLPLARTATLCFWWDKLTQQLGTFELCQADKGWCGSESLDKNGDGLLDAVFVAYSAKIGGTHRWLATTR